MNAPLGFTALTTLAGILATKKFTKDPLTGRITADGYGKAKHFKLRPVEFTDIDDLYLKLEILLPDKHSFIVRGQPLEGVDHAKALRRLGPEPDEPATFGPCSRAWVMLDLDFEPAPEGVDPVADPDGAVAFLLAALPPELLDVDLIVAWGSSQGIKPGKFSAHVFFLTSEAYSDADLKRWLLYHKAGAPDDPNAPRPALPWLDPVVFNPIQAHYTAAPVLVGLEDPLAGRRLVMVKREKRTATLVVPELPPPPPPGERRVGGRSCKGYEEYRARIGSEDGFHGPLLSAVGSYVATNHRIGTDVDALIADLQVAIREADPGGRDQAEIDRYASDDYLRKLIFSILRKEAAPKGQSFGTGPFEIRDGCIVHVKGREDGFDSVTVITNFSARITEERTIDDGAEIKHVFLLEGQLDDGSKLPAVEVPAQQFAGLGWVPGAWGSRPLIVSGQASKERAREAIQRFSFDPPARRRVVYQQTGFKKLSDGSLGFLHAGGAITEAGLVRGVDVRLDDMGGLSMVSLPEPPTGEALRTAVRTSLDSLLGLAPLQLTIPLLGATYRAPLIEVHEMPEALFLVGFTGTGKSELVARVQQHFGAEFHAKRLPAGWGDTANSLERVAFAAKDCVLVIDDFAPAGSREEMAKAHANVERLLRATGNSTGRGRMRRDGSLGPRYRPRGLVVSTAEDLPRMQSARARSLILQVEPGDVDFDALTIAQAHGSAGVFASSMSGYIRWIAGEMEGLRTEVKQMSEALRSKAQQLAESHRRTPEAVAGFMVGINLFLRFAQEVHAVAAREAAELAAQAWETLLEAGADQAVALQDADPVARFDRLLGALFSGGLAHVKDSRSGGPPRTNAMGLGWNKDDLAQGRCIGWVEDGALLLEPEGTFAAVQDLATRQNEGITLSRGTLWKRLDEAGRLLSRDGKYLTVRRQGLPGAGLRLRVLHLRWAPDLAIVEDEVAV